MNLKDELRKLQRMLGQPRQNIDLEATAAQLKLVSALVQDDDVQVTADLFDVLDMDARRACLSLFIAVTAQTLARDS